MAGAPAIAGGVPGAFDFYVLSMSWSPRPCASDIAIYEEDLCRDGGHGFDFTGLTPRYIQGAPTSCPTPFPTRLTAATLIAVHDLMPRSLAVEQWTARGVCTGLDPDGYFELAREALATVAVPPELRRPGVADKLTPRQIEDAFVSANPGLMADDVSVQCRQGVFTGVKVCLTRDLAFRPCGEVRLSSCQGGTLDIPEVD
jgi:ribonuclease T2